MKNYLNYCQTSNEVLFIFPSSQRVVLFLSHSLDGNQDRSTRTQSAAVTLQWQTTALHFKHGHYSQHMAPSYQKTRQVLWLLQKVVNITKRTAPWNLMRPVKRQSIDIKGQDFKKRKEKKKSCPHNVENTSTGHTQQVIYNAVFLLFLWTWRIQWALWMQQENKSAVHLCDSTESRCASAYTQRKGMKPWPWLWSQFCVN